MLARWLDRLHGYPHQMAAVATAIAAGTLVALSIVIGPARVAHGFTHFHPVWIALLFGGELAAYAGYTLGYRAASRIGDAPELTLPISARLVAAGFGAFAVGGGFAIDHRALCSAGAERRDATIRVLGLSALEYAILAPAAAICAAVLLAEASRIPIAITVPWVTAVPIGFGLALWLAHPRRREKVVRGPERVRDAIDVMLAGVSMLPELARRPLKHGDAYVGLSLYWAGEIACFAGALALFGLHPAIPAIVIAYATGYAATRRTLPLGGAGVTEALLVLSLHWIGVSWAHAIAPVVAYRAVNFGISLAPALGAHATVDSIIPLNGEPRERPGVAGGQGLEPR